LLIPVGIVGIYFPLARFNFINFDDSLYVVQNALVVGRRSIWNAFSDCIANNWHPVTWFSHILDYHLYGPWAGGHHLTNLLFHTGNALLLFRLLEKWTGTFWRSAVIAALFAWHPVHVESVAWISERKDVLSTFFALLCLWGYSRYAKQPSIWRYSAVFFLFALGLMSKPMLVTLPVLLLLLDFWPLERCKAAKNSAERSGIWKGLVLEKIPLLSLSVIVGLITVSIQVVNRPEESNQIGIGVRLANAVHSYAVYIEKLLWPHDLAVFYPYPRHFSPIFIVGACLLLLAISVLVCRYARTHPHCFVGWFWFVIALLPVIGIIQVGSQAMADRYTYIPSIGFFIFVIWGGCFWIERLQIPKFIPAVATTAALAGCLIISSKQVNYWKNSITLFSHALEVTSDNLVAHCNLGQALFEEGRVDEALFHINEALKINPRDFVACNSKGAILSKMGKLKEAEASLRTALEIMPQSAEGHSNLAKVLFAQGKLQQAETQWRQAIQLGTKSESDQVDLGVCLSRQGKFEEALAEIQVSSNGVLSSDAENALGSVYEAKGDTALAVKHYESALSLNPAFAEAESNLGALLLGQGRVEESVKHLQNAVGLKPDFPAAHYNLGNAYITSGKSDDAATHYREAVRLKPDYLEAWFNLGNALFDQKRPADALTCFDEALRIQPGFAEAHIRAAQVSLLLRKDGEGYFHFSRALELHPESPMAIEALKQLKSMISQTPFQTAAPQ
jgi:protein O-mannosyl-transferase